MGRVVWCSTPKPGMTLNWCSGFTKARPTAQIVALLAAAGIPTAEVQTLAEAAASPHAIARGLVSDLPHPRLGTARTVGQPVRFDGQKPIAETSAPALGADTTTILSRLGISHG